MCPWKLPDNPFPPDTVCIQVKVPNDPAYLDAFFGQMLDMATAYNWANDDAHTAILARNRCRQMYAELMENNCPVMPDTPPCSGCGDCEGCMACNLRFNCGVLEQFDCLTSIWVPVPSTGDCAENPAPGAGAPQPKPGQSSGNVCMKAEANQLTPLPWLVNTGDTLNFTSILGAGNDGSSIDYYCPDGSYFIAGACAGGGGTSGSDPLPTTKHMALLLKIGSTFYPLVGGIFTVPSSISNQQVFIQANTPTIANARGEYSICVAYQNNAVGSWHAQIDFTRFTGGFSAVNEGGTPAGVWTPAVGWASVNFTSGGENYTGIYITAALDPCTIDRIVWSGHCTGTHYTSIEGGEGIVLTAGENYITTNRLGDGPFNEDTNTTTYDGVGFTLPQSAQVLLQLFRWVSTHGFSGSGQIEALDVYGTGTPPSQLASFLV